MRVALDETARRRTKQINYNLENGITPKSVMRSLIPSVETAYKASADKPVHSTPTDLAKLNKQIIDLEKRMRKAAADLDFEQAAMLRDELKQLQSLQLL
jgi:excinuclease ABC subunit B